MTAINFPDAPVDGQVFASGNLSWTYKAGVGWLLNAGSVGGIAAGAGLVMTNGNTIDAVPANATLVVNPDSMNVNPNLSLTSLSTSGAVTAGGALTAAGANLNGNLNMGAGRKIDFADEIGTKIDMYANAHIIGVESGANRYESGGSHNFYTGTARTFYIDNVGAVQPINPYRTGDVTNKLYVDRTTVSGTVVINPSYSNVYEIWFATEFSTVGYAVAMNGDASVVPPVSINTVYFDRQRMTVAVYDHNGAWVSATMRFNYVAHGVY